MLANPASILFVPLIVLAEATWLVEHGKTSIPTIEALLDTVDADSCVMILSLDRPVLDKTLSLPMITEMHDRQIVASALLLGERGESIAMLTKDANIRDSGLVSVVW